MSRTSFRLPAGLSLYFLHLLVVNTAPVVAVFAIASASNANISTIVLSLVAFTTTILVYAARIAYRDFSIRRRAIRAGAVLPPSWEGKIIGNLDIQNHLMKLYHSGYPGDGLWDKIDELGHLHSLSIFWEQFYLTSDANVLKAVLATDFGNFEKGEEFRDTMNSVFGTGVFNADGEMWKFHRTMTRPYFTRDRISHLEMFDRLADLAVRKMKDRFHNGHALDFQDLVSRFTLDSATEFLFGRCVDSLQSDLPYAYNALFAAEEMRLEKSAADRFAEAFIGAQRVVAKRMFVGWGWRFLELHRDASAEYMKVVDAYLQPILEEKLRAKGSATQMRVPGKAAQEDGDDEAGEDETLLDHLVKKMEDPVVLHDEMLNVLIAGRDTTASTLTFAVYLLCLYPPVFKRLREEVVNMVGPIRMPTLDDIKGMKYLRAVINETLRIYPAVPLNFRIANHDTTFPNPDPTKPPVFVPANVGVVYSVFKMHRRRDYWGPDAMEFDPDRFLDERLHKYLTPNPFIFLPFNAGPRICLGQQFAYNEISFFLVRLLQHFSHMELDLGARPPDARPPPEWSRAEGHKSREVVVPKAHVTLYVHGGLWVKMTEAAEVES